VGDDDDITCEIFSQQFTRACTAPTTCSTMDAAADNVVGEDAAGPHHDHLFLEAAQKLEENPRLIYLTVHCVRRRNGEGPEGNDGDGDDGRWRRDARAAASDGLARFNSALEAHRCLEKLYFGGDCFGGLGEGSSSSNGRELRRLFSIVLPRHRSLTFYSFEDGSGWTHDELILPRGHLALLTEALSARERLPTSKSGYLPTLCFENTFLEKADYKAIATMLRRNAPVGCVKFIGSPNMDATDCQRICDGLLTNTTLRKLVFAELRITVNRNTFHGAVGRASPLLNFAFYSTRKPWTAEGVAGVVEALRCNSKLERLELYDPSRSYDLPALLRAHPLTFSWAAFLEPVLVHHNCALRRIELDPDEPPLLDELLRKNARVRKAHRALQRTEYRLQFKSLWSRAMGRIADKPDLLYKFVRHGNCHDVALHVATAAGRTTTRRRRPRADSRG
jgi:hypothetical protein